MKPIAFTSAQFSPPPVDDIPVVKNQPPSFNELDYWNSIARKVQHEFRSTRRQTFEKIHGIIQDFVFSNRDLPREDLDCDQVGHKLRESAQKDDVNMELLESEFIDFSFKILKKLQEVESGSENKMAP